MTDSNEIWSKLGEIEEHQALHVLHLLFDRYEEKLKAGEDLDQVNTFFESLGRAIDGACSCNASRR